MTPEIMAPLWGAQSRAEHYRQALVKARDSKSTIMVLAVASGIITWGEGTVVEITDNGFEMRATHYLVPSLQINSAHPGAGNPNGIVHIPLVDIQHLSVVSLLAMADLHSKQS